MSVALDDALERTPLEILRDLDPHARGIPARADGSVTTTYEASGVRIEFLTTNCGAGRDAPSQLPAIKTPALKTRAQALRMMDYLLRETVPAVVLHNAGIAVNVPAPARFAVHKLMVSQRRIGGKAGQDLAQASALIGVLAERQPVLLREALSEARDNGPSWHTPMDAAVRLLPDEARVALEIL